MVFAKEMAGRLFYGCTVTAHDRAQQCTVDAVLRAVERTVAFQQEVRQGVRAGRIRVDELVKSALPSDEDGQSKQHQG